MYYIRRHPMSQRLCKQNISRLLALLLAAMLVLSCIPMAYADGESGSCGSGLSWSLNAGTLTISGSGKMTDFPESSMAPWYHLRDQILRVELPGGLTHVGSLAFYGCSALTAVSVPGSVDSIGSYAFANCTGMEILNLGSVKTVAEGAFSDCYSLAALSLPGTLKTIGTKAFYRCESITSVKVPSSVTSLGMSAFGYCKSLVTADVQASISKIPEFLFYGCDRLSAVSLPDSTDSISQYAFRGCNQLSTVYYDSTEQSLDSVKNSIGSGLPVFGSTGYVSNETPDNSFSSGSGTDNGDGSVTLENVVVTPGTDASVTTKVEHTMVPGSDENSYASDITVSVNGEDGWQEAKDIVAKELEQISDRVSSDNVQNSDTSIQIYVNNTDRIDADFLNTMAGKPVQVTITTENGSVWKIHGSQLTEDSTSGMYDLSYTLSPGTEELSKELGSDSSFYLQFHNSAQVNSEVLIYLGSAWRMQNATLFQRDRNGVTRLQTVMTDYNGYAHYYLASVDEKTEYMIAMNLYIPTELPILPEEVLAQYGNAVNFEPIQYEITGRTSSWNMHLGQVMSILAAVMVGVVLIVGATMYIINKRRLKNGYVPQWDDDEE